MTDRTQFEAMLEALINEDHNAAKEIFHDIVVSKSRSIYEELLSEDFGAEEEEEGFKPGKGKDTGNPYASDEEEGEEEEEEGEEEEEEESGEGDDEDVEDRVEDLEDALEDLKAQFRELVAGEKEEPEHADMFGGEEDELDLDGDDEDADGELTLGVDDIDDESIMEYVNKVSPPKHGDDGVNNKSIVASKNDMGGKAFKLGGSEAGKGGTQGGLAKPTTSKMDGGNVNVPGAKSATKLKPVAGGHGAEKKGKAPDQDGAAKTGPISGRVR